jgi:spore coat polysaccharide biosynthesis protein SpsF (cytidylyltransferase family)
MRTVAIVQARMSSTRLPGKCLADIAGQPLLWHTVTRTRAAAAVDEVLVATSRESSDDPIERFCASEGVAIFRGDLDDVLDRFRRAARFARADRIVRVTADCPVLDHDVIDAVVGVFDDEAHDYVSNTCDRTFPDGLDTEVLSAAALERAWSEATLPSEREHVTPYIWKNPDRFRLHQVRQSPDRSAERWTVDEPRDLSFIREVFARIGTLEFGQREILALLDDAPELRRINAGIELNEGYRKSLALDP